MTYQLHQLVADHVHEIVVALGNPGLCNHCNKK